jgi:hypothetical protein
MIENITSWEALGNRLCELSRDGGAWTFTTIPFSNSVNIIHASNPSRLPDHASEDCISFAMPWKSKPVGWKGKLTTFSQAALIRQDNRGQTRG